MDKNYNLTFIIDDDPVFVLLFKKILSRFGLFKNVLNFENGQKAMEALINKHEKNETLADIIFLDINMPVLDGWEFLNELENQKFKNDLKIYMVTSSIDSKEIKKSQKYSVVKNFISKPIYATDFLEKLN